MNDQERQHPWGERLAAEGAAAADEPSLRRLLTDAVGVVRGRVGEVSRSGVRPLLDEAAAQVRPATLEELRARYPGLADVIAAQQAMAVASAAAPPVAGTTLGSIGVTALAEVLALFVVEAKLRADLGALAGQPALSARELAANVLENVQAAGGWKAVRGRSMRRALPDAAARRAAARLAAMVPARFARIIIPELVAPLIGSAIAARLASRQIRAGGEQHWGRLRTMPRTTASWGPVTPNGGRPPAGWHPSGWGPPPGDEPRQLPPPPER
jgi:hypothetical protein